MNTLDDILRKVQALIAQADHPNTGPAEADTFRAKAEALMLKYRIDEMMLSTAEKAQMGVAIQWRTIRVCDANSEFRSYYVNIIHSLVRHFDVRADYVVSVGRTGGDMMMRKMFADEARLRGEFASVLLGKGNNMALYRESFAQGFTEEFARRLYRMRYANAQVSGGLVLASRKENIDEAFYARYPERRPKPVDRQLGEEQISECGKCKKAQSGYCRDHAWMRPRKGRVRYANGHAMDRGRAAAQAVDLGITGREVR